MKMFMTNRGFTLIELMTVIAILGTLAAIAIPNYLGSRERARVTVAISDIKGIEKAIISFMADTGRLPATLLEAGLGKHSFPLIIALALWIILFLSLFFIRRTLSPLLVLQEGSKRIGAKDFTSRVDIASGDEFEELADSFNTMSSQHNKQFHTLALIDEIDRSILSSLDPSVIVPRSLRLLSEFISDQLAIALSNARLVSDLERLSIGTVEALARTVDAKSKWTSGHSERVADLAVRIGQVMQVSNELLEQLFRGGLLHDIGKIGVPLAILDKPGRLDTEEYETIKSHPVIGGKILEPIEAYKDVLPIIMQHHERFDGKGYPDGLQGEAISLGARILSIADVYDALISQRPYRQGWVKEEVITFIRNNSGVMFDPQVVDTFLLLET